MSTDKGLVPLTGEECDPLQVALDDAQQWMNEFDVDSGPAIDGFAIDSDDDDDDEVGTVDIPLDDETDALVNPSRRESNTTKNSTSTDSTSGNGTSVGAGTNVGTELDSTLLHPLSDDFLQSRDSSLGMNTENASNNNTTIGTERLVGASPSPSSTFSDGLNPHGTGDANNIQTTTPNHASMGNIHPTHAAQSLHTTTGYSASSSPHSTAASMDVWKSHTTRLASNFVHLATRAASQVAHAATSTNQASSQGYSTTMGTGGGVYDAPSAIHTGPSKQPVPSGYCPSVTGTSPRVPPSHAASTNGTIPAGANNNTSINSMPSSLPVVELDKEQKELLVQTHVGDLLPGEKIIMFLSNLLHVSDSSGFTYSHQTEPSTTWFCAMTYYRLLLFGTHPISLPSKPADWNGSAWPRYSSGSHKPALWQIPLSAIDKVDKSVFSATASHTTNPTTLMGLALLGKDGRVLRFTTPSYADTLRAHEALQTYAFPGRRNLGYLFAFESKREAVLASVTTDATTGTQAVTLPPTRKRFDAVPEFERQFRKGSVPWTIWQNLNVSYQTCGSYPDVLVGPAALDDSQPDGQSIIRQCAAFRSEHRLPALTWSSGIDGASLWRASQPKIGLQGNRSAADELFLQHVLESARSANAVSTQSPKHWDNFTRVTLQALTGKTDLQPFLPDPNVGLKILDLRPRSAAMANRTGGYGYENVSNYAGTTLQFCNIGNIHAVRDAYQKVTALCTNSNVADVQWNALVEDTKWLSHLRIILSASWEAAYWIHVHRLPVLMHCSHGWDRTSQVAVLTQLLLDPYYRTREGFACVVEKDFMSFGHPFHTRCAHGEGRGNEDTKTTSSDEGQISPIFLQFLDCVYQIVSLYPECFEFNTKYLLLLSEHVYSCRFGSFLCDTEREREMVAGIRQRTHSVWDYLDGRDDLLSPLYDSTVADGVLLMPLPTLLRHVSLWTDRHCLHGPKSTQRWWPTGLYKPVNPEANQESSALETKEEMAQWMWNTGVYASVGSTSTAPAAAATEPSLTSGSIE